MKDFRNPANWKRTSKKLYNVYMCRPELGTEVHNRLEHCDYTTNEKKQFVLSGTVGEQWIIDGNKLASTYEFEDGTPINPQTLGAKITKGTNGQIDWIKLKTRQSTGQFNYAFHLPINEIRDFPVKTSWGETLYANKGNEGHGTGDFLVCATNPDGSPNLNDMWVVNGNVFATTYDMRPFPGIASKEALEHETERPSVSLIIYNKNTETVESTVNKQLSFVEKFFKDIEENLFKYTTTYDSKLQSVGFKVSDIDLELDVEENLARIDFECSSEYYSDSVFSFIYVNIRTKVATIVVMNSDDKFHIEKNIDLRERYNTIQNLVGICKTYNIKVNPLKDSIYYLKQMVYKCIEFVDEQEADGKTPEDIVKYISSKLSLGGYRISHNNESFTEFADLWEYADLWEIDYPAAVDNTSIVIQFIDWEITNKIKDIGITLVVDADEYFSKEISIRGLDEAINEINKGLQVYTSLVNANNKTTVKPVVSEKTQRIKQSQGTISGVMGMFNRNK